MRGNRKPICEGNSIAVQANGLAVRLALIAVITLAAALPVLLGRSTAQAACAGGPVIFNCSGSDAVGTISYFSTPAPTFNLTGETITGAGGHGINVQTSDSSTANTAVVTMDSASSITLTDFNRGLNLITQGANISVNVTGAITTNGGNSIFAQVASGDGAVSITTNAGAAMTGRITGQTFGAGDVTIVTNAPAALQFGTNNAVEGSSAIDTSTFGSGNVSVTANAAIKSVDNGIQGVAAGSGNVVVMTGAGGTINAKEIGILAESTTGTINVTSNAAIATTANAANVFSVVATSDAGDVSVTNNATVGNFGVRARAGGSGTVTVTANAGITGNGVGGAINAGTVDGLLTLNVNNAATIAAGNAASDAIHVVTTGSGGVAINTAAGTAVKGAGGGIFVDQSAGTGSTVINNNGGAIFGVGTAAKPVISVATNGTTTINNSGLVASNGLSAADLAISTGGGVTVVNNSGAIAGRVSLAGATFNNSNIWTVFGANTFSAGAAAINNSGTLTAAGTAGDATSVTSFTATDALTVTNTGLLAVSGAANFIGAAGSSFANAGGLIDMRQGVVGDAVAVSGNFSGGANSRLGVDTFLGGVGSKSDQLMIGGNVAANTGIIVHDVNPGPGGFTGPGGIPIVTVAGTSSPADFTLSPQSTVIGGGFLPINGGILRKGLFDYYLVDDPGVFALVSVPNAVLFQMPVAVTAAQNIWYETALGWEDRQTELRDFLHRGGTAGANAQGAAGLTMPVKAPPQAAAGVNPGMWIKGIGSWTTRSDAQTFSVSTLNIPVDLGYKQNIYGVIGGVDFSREEFLSSRDSFVAGLMGGLVSSGLNFNTLPTTFRYSGGTAGVSATYMNGGFFADALVKADFLRLDGEDLPAGAGTTGTKVNSTTWGALGSIGYHAEFGRGFLEPLATLAFTRTFIEAIGLPAAGVTVGFGDQETFRGALGARFGARLADNSEHALDASIVARVWDQFTGNNTANIANIGAPLVLTDRFTGTFGEVTGHLDWLAKRPGWSAFLAGGAKFNRDFTTTTAKGGLSYHF